VECGCLSVWHFILTKLSLLLLNSVASSSETETTHEFRACLMHSHKNSGSIGSRDGVEGRGSTPRPCDYGLMRLSRAFDSGSTDVLLRA
jgi:hypothetical protein